MPAGCLALAELPSFTSLPTICFLKQLRTSASLAAYQAVKEQLRGYERGLADATAAQTAGGALSPRSEADMAIVQAQLKSYSEVCEKDRAAFMAHTFTFCSHQSWIIVRFS